VLMSVVVSLPHKIQISFGIIISLEYKSKLIILY
jgi:hypothetical protein